MKDLIIRIEKLEAKQENGTITFEEQQLFHKLIELAEGFIFNNK